MQDIPNKTNIAIIGGGIAGVCVAYQLAQHGADGIAVFEKEEIAGEATGLSGGSVRPDYLGNHEMIKAVKYGVDFYQKLADEEKIRPLKGNLFLGYTDEMEDLFQEKVRVLEECGWNEEMVSKNKVKELFPHLNTEEVKSAMYGPDDIRFDDPYHITDLLAKKAQEKGVYIFTNTPVKGIDRANDHIQGLKVKADSEDEKYIEINYLVNCAGAWMKKVNQMAGLDLPFYPIRTRFSVTEPIDEFDYTIPSIEGIVPPDQEPDFHEMWMHNEQKGLLFHADMYYEEIPDPDRMKSGFTSVYLAEIAEKIAYHFPDWIDKIKIKSNVAAKRSFAQDGLTGVGRSREVSNFYYLGGGHGGFMQAPGLGLALAELILEGNYRTFDMAPWDIRRLTERDYKGPPVDHLRCPRRIIY